MSQQALREIPAVDKILDQFAGQFAGVSRSVLLRAVRLTVDNLRRRVLDELLGADAVAEYLHGGAFEAAVRSEVNRLQSARHRAVVNATGILLHTGLGRAPLSDRARQAASEVGRYALVEVDPATGQRGRRETFVRDLLCELTGAEEATVVNNNAAAVLLLLRGLARDHEVLVSRGELVEIGGGFRVPAVMAESGAKLVEVGTTNRTRIADYQQAVTENTALLLHVHSSNFKIVGFTEAPSLAELVELGQRASVLVGTDLGSGYLRRMPQLPFPEEPVVSEAVAAGVDVATFSGDKMLGGPQCGILVGKRAAILALRREPLFRALRPDKLTLAALEATLLQWRAAGDEVPTDLPFFAQLVSTPKQLTLRAKQIQAQLQGCLNLEITDSQAQVGSGSVPGFTLDSVALTLSVEGSRAERLAHLLRTGRPPVFSRLQEGRLWLDLRTVAPAEDEVLVDSLQSAAQAW